MRPMSSRIILAGMTIILALGSPKTPAAEHVAELGSAVKQLGRESDFKRTGEVLLVNPGNWGRPAKDGDVTYRCLKAGMKAEVFFAAFDVDNNGFCKHDMILEIYYRDDIKQQPIGNRRVRGRVVVKSRIDFAKDNEYIEVGHLQAAGDGKWKLARIFLERTLRQMVRAIDGSFQFKIVMPSSGSIALPVSYLRLISIGPQEFVKLREIDRAKRGLKRIEYEGEAGIVSPPDEWEKRGFVVFPANYLKLVFPNTAVDYDRAGSELRCFEIPGKQEPVSFVIHAFEDLSDVQVKVSDLHCGTDIIPADMVRVCQVIYNDQRWGWGWANRYGICPDYLSMQNPVVDIKANSNCQFWLTINVPETTAGGLYKGEVKIYINGKQARTIGLSVEVLPIKPLPNRVKHMVFHSPHLRSFHRDRVKVLQDMKKHGLVPILYPFARITKTRKGLDVRLDPFEPQLPELRKVYPNAKELFVVLENYENVWRELGGDEPRFTRWHTNFEMTYGKVLKKYAELAKSYGFEFYFSFHDEPFKNIERRRDSYLNSRIAQSKGLKTWSTQNLADDVQLTLTPRELRANVNYLRPLREVLDVFVEAVIRVDESVIKTLQKSRCDLSYGTAFPATSVRPVYNRILHGIYPFVTNTKFVLCYAYRDALGDPYDDLDLIATQSSIGMNDYLLTYPTWQGAILPTLSYEALREGIEDSELISTLQILAERALQTNDPKMAEVGKEAREYFDAIAEKVGKDFKRRCENRGLPVDPMEKAILRDLNNGQSEDHRIFDKIRRDICDRIIALQSALAQ